MSASPFAAEEPVTVSIEHGGPQGCRTVQGFVIGHGTSPAPYIEVEKRAGQHGRHIVFLGPGVVVQRGNRT